MSEVWSANFVLLSITDVAYFLLVPLLATSPFLSVLKHKVKHCAGDSTQQRCRRGDSHVARHWRDPFWGRINSDLPGSDAAFLPIVFSFFSQRQKEKLAGIGAGWLHSLAWKYQGGKCFKMTWNWVVQPWPSMLVSVGLGDAGQFGQSKTQPTTRKPPQRAATVPSSPVGAGEVGAPGKVTPALADPRSVVWKQELWGNVKDLDVLSLEARRSRGAWLYLHVQEATAPKKGVMFCSSSPGTHSKRFE